MSRDDRICIACGNPYVAGPHFYGWGRCPDCDKQYQLAKQREKASGGGYSEQFDTMMERLNHG